jgi:hypothetical protein
MVAKRLKKIVVARWFGPDCAMVPAGPEPSLAQLSRAVSDNATTSNAIPSFDIPIYLFLTELSFLDNEWRNPSACGAVYAVCIGDLLCPEGSLSVV